MSLPRINFLAVFVAAVAVIVIGFFWYSPLLFSAAWIQGHGYTQAQMDAMKGELGRIYGIIFLSIMVMGTVLYGLLGRMGINSAAGGARLGAVIWLGFAATLGLMAHLYTQAPFSLYLIDAGYQLVYITAMGGILGWFRSRAA
jgi:hypothetical protein